MRNFFSKLGSTPSGKKTSVSDAEVQGQLAEAQAALQKLRQTPNEDFPLLNESTRLVQALEGSVTKMPDGDMRGVWREQLVELQRGLQQATERMLSKSGGQAGTTLFDGLSMDTQGAMPGPAYQPAAAPEPPALGGDMFMGLTVGGLDLGGPPEQAPAAVDQAVSGEQPGLGPAKPEVLPVGVSSGPLPEDLFSGLDDVSVSSNPAADPFQGAPPSTSTAATQPNPSTGLADVTAERSAAAESAHAPGSVWQGAGPTALVLELGVPSGDGKRKKKITRRVGYAREGGAPQTAESKSPNSMAQRPASAASPAPDFMFDSSLVNPGFSTASESFTLPATSQPVSPVDAHADSRTSKAAPLEAQEGLILPDELSKGEHLMGMAEKGGEHLVALNHEVGSQQEGRMQLIADGLSSTASPVHIQNSLASTIGVSEHMTPNMRHAAEARLDQDLSAAAAKELATKQRRRKLRAELRQLTGEISQLREAEASAVDSEDFDSAARLSNQSDILQLKLTKVEEETRAADQAVQRAVATRWKVAEQQAKVWREAAKRLQDLCTQHEEEAHTVAAEAAQLAPRAEEIRAAALERREEMLNRISARRRWLAEEKESLDRKLAEALRPASVLRDEQAVVVDALLKEVEALRAALAEKEAALGDAQQALQSSQKQVDTLASKFDKTIARLEADRQAVEAEEAAQAAEESSWQADEERIASAQAEAYTKEQSLKEQAAAAAKEAEEMLARAADLDSACAAEASSRAQLDDLHRAQEAAETLLQGVRQGMDAARAQIRELVASRTAIAAAAQAADERALAAKRRLPELEANKKTAAAARDFKEAARLSAEAKALLSSFQASEQEAAELRKKAACAEAEEREALRQLADKEGSLREAELATALARWQHLQALLATNRQQLEAALSADDFGEAEALQAEIDEAVQEADSLAASNAFHDADLGAGALESPRSSKLQKPPVPDIADLTLPPDDAVIGAAQEPAAASTPSHPNLLDNVITTEARDASMATAGPNDGTSVSSLRASDQQKHVSLAPDHAFESLAGALQPAPGQESSATLEAQNRGSLQGQEALSESLSWQDNADVQEKNDAGEPVLDASEIAENGTDSVLAMNGSSQSGGLFGGLSLEEASTNGLQLPAETTQVARWSPDEPAIQSSQEAGRSDRVRPSMISKLPEPNASQVLQLASTNDAGAYSFDSDCAANQSTAPLDKSVEDGQDLLEGFPDVEPSPSVSFNRKASATPSQESARSSSQSEIPAATYPKLGASTSINKEVEEEAPEEGRAEQTDIQDGKGGNKEGNDLFAGLMFC